MTLYAITLLYLSSGHKGFAISSRPAICTTLERAREIVENNEDNIHGRPNSSLACIEAVLTDTLQQQHVAKEGYKQWWYKWKDKEGGEYGEGQYIPCEIPDEHEINHSYTINMAIG